MVSPRIDRARVRQALTGPIATIRTPFQRDGAVDLAGLRRMIDFDIDAGSGAIVLTAGDSHYIALSDDEITEVTQVTVDHVAGRALVVAADRYYHTRQSVEFARFAAGAGADVLMVLPPDWGGSSTVDGLTRHYAAIAEHIPIMLVTGIFLARGADFGPRCRRQTLDQVEGVVAIKDDFCGEFARKMGLLVYDRWAVWSGGQKQNHMNAHPYGCDGYLSSFLSFHPPTAHRYWQAIVAGDLAAAQAVIRDIDMPFFDYILGVEGGFDAAVHGILELVGIAGRWRPPPYHSLTDAQMEELGGFLRGLGVL
ncbi:MAG: dihydrodipicolinate synthase family protein [bacterium]|nr:dihydrodipicolinate synthase family protein [bacterium]